jgi:hypothetical protein
MEKQETRQETIHRLIKFRQHAHRLLTQARDAQFELVDALLLDTEAQSPVELSLNPVFRRQWSSVYAALRDGEINEAGLMRLYLAHVPCQDRPLWALDTTTWQRPDAVTLPERGIYYVPSRVKGNKPIGVGHAYSTVAMIPEATGSWALPLRHERVGLDHDAVTFGAQQVIDLAQHSDVRPLVTVDSHYSNPKWLDATVDAAFDTLGRLRPNRNLYRRPGPYSGRGTKQRKHGPPLKLKHAATWHDPDAWLGVQDDKLGRVEIMVWHDLHFRKAPDREVTVIRIHRLDARGTRRDPKDLWLMYDGQTPLDPVGDWRTYLRRFAIEHWYRFVKNDLLWVNFAGTDLHNTQHWSWLVTLAYWHLWLARPLVLDQPRPWEHTVIAPEKLTPGRVKRALGGLLAAIGTPTQPPKPRGNSPGRASGQKMKPRPRYPVRKKGKPKPKKSA